MFPGLVTNFPPRCRISTPSYVRLASIAKREKLLGTLPETVIQVGPTRHGRDTGLGILDEADVVGKEETKLL